jgi:hypothetical protein
MMTALVNFECIRLTHIVLAVKITPCLQIWTGYRSYLAVGVMDLAVGSPCVAGDATSVSALWLCAAALRCCRVCACTVRVLCDVCMRCAPAK